MSLLRRYLFIRHARPVNDTQPFRLSALDRDMRGVEDRALAPIGREQAHALGRALRGQGIERIVSSDLLRAKETADILASQLGLPVTDRRPELNELRPGLLEAHPLRRAWVEGLSSLPGGLRPRAEALTAGALAMHYLVQWRLGRTRGGDRWGEVPARLAGELRWLDGLPEERIAVVCHGYLIWHLAGRVLAPGLRRRARMLWVPNVSVTTALADGEGRYRLESFARVVT